VQFRSCDRKLTVVDVTQGSYGEVTIDADGTSVIYTPNDPAYFGQDSFQYQVQDASGALEWATVDVSVVWIDLDVNNDGDIVDAIDGVDNYLPGYVGEQNVLSTGTSFNDVQYVGQQVRLIVEGIGYESGVEEIEFELFDVTSFAGFSGNTSDPAIEGPGREDDVSFAQSEDQREFLLAQETLAADGGQMQANRNWVQLWSKDYGAYTKVGIRIQLPGGGSRTFTVDVPTDINENNINDLWEYSQAVIWEHEFGQSIEIAHIFLSASDDSEPEDADGEGAGFNSTAPNSGLYISDIREEGTAGIISVEFVNAAAASGLSVSTTTNGDDTTITVELADDGTNITSTANDIINALNTDGTANTLVSAKTIDGDGSGTVNPTAATALGRLPAHEEKGDSLTVEQEYRGFVLDGGGFDAWGGGAHSGGHTRLSPVYKELLVEVDVMANIPATLEEIKGALAFSSQGFSDADNGAGLRMYWVIDDTDAEHDVFDDDMDRIAWSGDRRNEELKDEFVHLMFVDDQTGRPNESLGSTSPLGAFIWVTNLKEAHDDNHPNTDFKKLLGTTTTHELTHALLSTENMNGFDDKEHVINPDPEDGPDGDKDKKYVMYKKLHPDNAEIIIFSDVTIRQLDLVYKETVEI